MAENPGEAHHDGGSENVRDELVEKLGWIAFHKNLLPFGLRGWVNSLGLHVQEKRKGAWTRLQAGGSFRSYLDAWQEGSAYWQIKKFDEGTWKRRFAAAVEPTLEIAEFLDNRHDENDQLSSADAATLQGAIDTFKGTGTWPGLPSEPTGRDRRIQRMKEQQAQELEAKIRDLEAKVNLAENQWLAWSDLGLNYFRIGRFKEMESAMKRSIRAAAEEKVSPSPNHRHLGKVYLSALSYSFRNQGLPLLTGEPSPISPESLDHAPEEVKELAIEHLTKAQDSPYDQPPEVDRALRIAREPSVEAFEELDEWLAEESRKDIP